MKSRSYNANQIPFISDVGVYFKQWAAWWTSCQPAWRQTKEWPLLRDRNTATWTIKSGPRGQNGLFLIIMSTTWWASSIQSAKDWAEFDEAMEDIQWVIDQLISTLDALPAPASPTRSDIPNTPTPAQGATWMVRENGKRQPKPSRRLMEASGI